VWLCHSANSNIDFEVKVGVCYGAAEIKDREKDFDLGNGEYLYAVAVGIENEDKTREPLPSRAEALKYI
jgi:hypothetical protein